MSDGQIEERSKSDGEMEDQDHSKAIVCVAPLETTFRGKSARRAKTARSRSKFMGKDGIPAENFYLKFDMYDPLKIVPQWKGSKNIKRKNTAVEDNWIDMIDKCCNEKVTDYMKTVREVRANAGKTGGTGKEIVTRASNYKSNGRMIMRLPLLQVWSDASMAARKYVLGKPSRTDPQKSIILLGAKDCGKSTMIDCMANHALGVKWEDKFTLRVTDPDESVSQNGSKWINAYTIPSTSDTAMPFAINLVDVPGFSRVKQNRADEAVLKNLKNFMKNPVAHEMDSFSAIWFVYQAHMEQVPPVYMHLYKELVKMYGRGIEKSITNLITFAKDEEHWPVVDAIEDAGLPSERIMSFNNMLVFNKEQGNPYSNAQKLLKQVKKSWACSQEGLDELAGKVESAKPVSAHISPEDLDKRDRATEGLRQLNILIRIGCQKLQVMHQEKDMIQEKVDEKQVIAEVADFKYAICKPVKVKRELPYCGEQVTNCSICFVTCHQNCAVVDDDAKHACCAMQDGYCTVCPGKCYWDQHFNRAFQIFLRMEKETKRFSDLPKEFDVDAKNKVGVLLEALQGKSASTEENVKQNIQKAMQNMATINEISGRDVSRSYNDCIDVIIHEEMRDGMPEWEKRVDLLKMLKEEGKLGIRIAGKKETEKML